MEQQTFVNLTLEEIEMLSNTINDLFANMAGADILAEGTLLAAINIYLQQLEQLNSEVLLLREQFVNQQNSSLQKMAMVFGDKIQGTNLRKASYKFFGEQNQIFEKSKKLFSIGYSLVNKIREYITGQTIKYHVAIERAASKQDIIYEATEQHIVSNLKIDQYRFMQALITGQSQELSFEAKYRATVKNSEIFGETSIIQENLSKKGSTLWSKGYQVYQEVKKKQGINFGHFLETYYYFGGNKMNRKIRDFNAIEFYQYMIALQNSTEFYKSGDFQDIQLKSNTATITNIKTIKSILLKIQEQLINYKSSKKTRIKQLLTEKKLTKEQMQKKASKIEITEEMRKILEPISSFSKQ